MKGKRQPACWPEALRAEGYLLREQDVPLALARCSQGWFSQRLVVALVVSFHRRGRSWCQAVLSSDASPLSLHQFPRRSPGLQGSDWSLQTPEPVSQQMAFPLSWKPGWTSCLISCQQLIVPLQMPGWALPTLHTGCVYHDCPSWVSFMLTA